MTTRFRLGVTLPLVILGLAAMLGGCVVYPAYPAYGVYRPYGYGAPDYGGGYYRGYYGDWRR
jgi:hypothetical protein